MIALSRLPVVLKSRGLTGLIRLAYRRLVHQHWTSMVFRDDQASRRREADWPAGYVFEFCDRAASLPDRILKALEAARAAEITAGAGPDDQLYCVWHGEKLVAYGAVFVHSRQRWVLGLPEEAVLIGDCFTVPAHRRRGLYRLALNAVALRLRMCGNNAVYVEANPRNIASIRGIIGAGFVASDSISADIWFRFFVRQNRAWHLIGRWRSPGPAGYSLASRAMPSNVATRGRDASTATVALSRAIATGKRV